MHFFVVRFGDVDEEQQSGGRKVSGLKNIRGVIHRPGVLAFFKLFENASRNCDPGMIVNPTWRIRMGKLRKRLKIKGRMLQVFTTEGLGLAALGR